MLCHSLASYIGSVALARAHALSLHSLFPTKETIANRVRRPPLDSLVNSDLKYVLYTSNVLTSLTLLENGTYVSTFCKERELTGSL